MISPNPRTSLLPPGRDRRGPSAHLGFTLLELLVVMGLIGVLLGAVLVAAPALIDKSRENKTRLLLTAVNDMIDAFAREQEEKPTLARSKEYRDRYGYYPPDELEPFTEAGVPISSGFAKKKLAPGGVQVVPTAGDAEYPQMLLYIDEVPAGDRLYQHRDLLALIVAIELFGRESRDMLANIPSESLVAVPTGDSGEPVQFLDRPDASGTPDGDWDPETDLPLRYIVDAWGVPLRYFAQRNYDPAGTTPDSNNYEGWYQASTEMIRRNGGRPIILSFGANGKDQLTKQLIDRAPETASMVGDWINSTEGNAAGVIDDPLNLDNVYVDPLLKDKLASSGGS